MHPRHRQAKLPGDAATREPLAPQQGGLLHQFRQERGWRTPGPGRPIPKLIAICVAAQPLINRSDRNAQGCGHAPWGLSPCHPAHQFLSLNGSHSGIGKDVHSVLPWPVGFSQTQSDRFGPSEQRPTTLRL